MVPLWVQLLFGGQHTWFRPPQTWQLPLIQPSPVRQFGVVTQQAWPEAPQLVFATVTTILLVKSPNH